MWLYMSLMDQIWKQNYLKIQWTSISKKKRNSSALTDYLCNNRDSLLAAQSQVVLEGGAFTLKDIWLDKNVNLSFKK